MRESATILAGIEIPSSDPVFLAIVAVHILLGMICVVTGAAAMLSPKAAGRHPRFGTIYFWSLTVLVAAASVLAFMRWAADTRLFILGMLALTSAIMGRTARRRRWPHFGRLHIMGMGTSYIVMLTAFYVDNGRQLPVWRNLPHWTYWTLPAVVGTPIMIRALIHHKPTPTCGN